MLDPFNKDFPQQESAQFSDDNTLSKRKLIFALSGTTFALVFFLFLMGLFRDNDESCANKPSQSTHVAALEEQIKELHKRLDHLESSTLALANTPSQKNDSQQTPEAIPHPSGIQTPQEALAMTNRSLLRHMANSVSQDTVVAIDTTPAPAAPFPQPTAAIQQKIQKHPTTVPTEPITYVVKKGDTLSKLSLRFYGTPNRWKVIYNVNKEKIPNMNNLRVGATLIIPPNTPKQAQ